MIYAIMIVGEGEAGRYLSVALERAARWADGVHVALEPGVTDAERAIVEEWGDSSSELKFTAHSNEAMAKDQAWLDATHAFGPVDGEDYFGVIKPTETILDPTVVRKTIKEFPGQAYQCKLYHLWDSQHVRVDGDWSARLETFIIPWRRGGAYPDIRMRAGRLPEYHFNVPLRGVSMSDVVDYDMMTFADKLKKWEWFVESGANGFYSEDHIQSIKRVPELRTWRKGGIVAVEANR